MIEEKSIITIIGEAETDVSPPNAQVEILPPDQRDLEDIADDIISAKAAAAQSILEIGNLLIEAKAKLPRHGQWLDWLSDRVDISERTAERYMQLAREFSNPTALSDLGMTKSLALLALPKENRDGFIKEIHEVNGKQKTVQEMSTREFKKTISQKIDTLRHGSDKCDTITQRTPYDKITSELKLTQKHLDAALELLKLHRCDPNIRGKFFDSVQTIIKTAQEFNELIPAENSMFVSPL